MKPEVLKELEQFLLDNVPVSGCAVFRTTKGEYVFAVRYKASNKDTFTINGHFWYDYDFLWVENGPWKVLWTHDGSE